MAKKPNTVDIYKDEPWDPSDTCDVPIDELYEAIKSEGCMAYDLETTGLSPRKDRMEGIAFYVPNEKDSSRRHLRAWFPFTEGTMNHTNGSGVVESLREPMPLVKTMEQLLPIYKLKDVIAVRANGIFDDAFLYLTSGLDEPLVVENIIADSMLADYVADERRRRYGLKPRTDQVFGHKMTTYNEAAGGQASFGFANKKPLGVYACDDTAWTYRLWKWAIEQIRLQDPPRQHKDDWCSPIDGDPGFYSDLEKIYWKIEMKIQRILMEMEITGCFIDWEWLVKVQERVQKQQQEILEEFKTTVGWVPNLRSPKQVSDFLYNSVDKGGLGLPTKGVEYNEDLEQYATGEKSIKHREKQFPLVGKMLKYRSLSVIDNSFCKKLIKLGQEDGRVFARFRQTGTVIGRICIASGTQVEILRDVSKFPSGIPIEDVKPGDLAYTYDDDLNLTLRPVVKSWKTGHKNVVRVHWRGSGNKHNGHVDLTPDHPVRLIDGSYTLAGELKTGDRCLALSRGVNGDGYARVYPTKSACIGREHRWAYEEVHGPVGELLVHHKDGNKLNNLLENLETKTHSDHSRDHSKEMWTRPETRAAITAAVTNRWNDPEYKAKHHERMKKMWRDGRFVKPSGREHPQYIELAQEWLEAELWTHAGHPTLVARANGLNYNRVKRFIKEYEIDIKTIQLLHRSDGTLITCEQVEAARSQTNQRAMLKMIGVNYYKFKALQEHFGFDEVFNHSITHVEILDQTVDVYDLEIEGTHNFIAGELCVHNSSADPVNLMNQPREKNLIRKAFCAHLENDFDPERNELCLIDADYGQMELRMAAHLANERNMIEVYSMVGGCSAGEGGGPCERYTFYECFQCHKKAPPTDTPDGPKCASCGAHGGDIEHQKRCRHVDLHQRTAEDVGVPRNPLAKNSNFGLLYRMGAPKFCIYAGLFDEDGNPRVEFGQELINKWHAAYPGIATWHARTIQQLVSDDYVAYNIARRRRRLDIEWKKNDYRAGTQAIQFRVSGCVVPSTAVLTERGYVEIKDLTVDKLRIFDGAGFTDDYDVHETGTKKVFKLTLLNGRSLTCSADHRFATMNGLSWEWSKLSELSVDDMIATHDLLAPLGDSDHGATVDDAYLIGALIGDGYYGSSQGFTLAASAKDPGWPESLEESVIASQGELAKKKFRWGIRKTSRGGLVKDLVVNSSAIRSNLMILGLDCVSKQEKRIPEWAYTAEPEIRAAILAGLFDTDGSVLSYKQKTYTSLTIQYSSRVKALVDGAWRLASSLGIDCGVHAFNVESSSKAGGRTIQYRLDVTYRGFHAFDRWVGLRHPRKAATLAGTLLLIAKKAPRRVFPPSFVRAVAELAAGSPVLASRQGSSKAFDDRKLRRRVQTYIGHARDGKAGQNMIEAVLDYVGEHGPKQVMDYGWSKITSIEPMGESATLDIEIHGKNHAYVADGFFTHNSCQDLIKLAMIKLYDTRNEKIANLPPAEAALWGKFKFLIQVHDELIFEAPKEIREELCALVKHCMESVATGMRIPFVADARSARTWDELH